MVLSRTTLSFFRPAEWARHSHCILAWPGLKDSPFQTSASLTAATDEVSSLVRAISRFEPVSLIVGQDRLHEARSEFESKSSTTKHMIRIHSVPGDGMNLWMRDIAPTFTLYQQKEKSMQQLFGVDFNFNGWGNRHVSAATVDLARILLEDTKTNRVQASITTEGGALEVDGEGTLLVTESSIINNNRNPGKGKADIEKELQRCLGVSKIIWVPGVMNADSTDCHVDALARFASPGVVLLSRPVGPRAKTVWMKVYEETKDILCNQQDAQGRSLEIIDILEPDMALLNLDEESMKALETASGWSPVMSYVNYYLPNGGLVIPKFGDEEADTRAFEILKGLFGKEREAVQVYINELPLLGGGIHCATQEVPLS